jgi:hypothetical protein
MSQPLSTRQTEPGAELSWRPPARGGSSALAEGAAASGAPRPAGGGHATLPQHFGCTKQGQQLLFLTPKLMPP